MEDNKPATPTDEFDIELFMSKCKEAREYQKKYATREKLFDDCSKEIEKWELELEKMKKLINSDFDQESESKLILNCKHLTDGELKQHHKSNKLYLEEIVQEKTYCSRHERFFQNNFTNENLIYNTSMSMYTSDQITVLLNLLDDQFCSSFPGVNNQYFFKVLLPELCKKIFMTVHDMNYEEATAYLADGTLPAQTVNLQINMDTKTATNVGKETKKTTSTHNVDLLNGDFESLQLESEESPNEFGNFKADFTPAKENNDC